MKLLYFPLLFLFGSPVLMAQKDTTACNLQIGIRHNGHIDIYQHPKIGLPGGPLSFPGSDWYDIFKDTDRHYYEGIGITKKKDGFFYRLWVDYYNYSSQSKVYYPDSMNNYYEGSYVYRTSGLRLSPGVGKQWHWKFMGFSAGVEIPVYFQIKKEGVWETPPNYYVANETLIETYIYKNGLTVGLTAFAGVNFHFLKRMSAGMELSNGVLFQRKLVTELKYDYYDVQGKLYKTDIFPPGEPGWEKKPRWFYLIPSISLSYRL